jgi:hypothetical protein
MNKSVVNYFLFFNKLKNFTNKLPKISKRQLFLKKEGSFSDINERNYSNAFSICFQNFSY